MKKIILLACCLLLGALTLLQAQTVPQLVPRMLYKDSLSGRKGIELSGTWLFQPADIKTWPADTIRADRSWFALDPAENLFNAITSCKGCRGIGWLKYRIRIDSALVNVPLAFELNIRGASEVYLGQKFLASAGRFTARGIKGKYMARQKPAVFVLSDTGVVDVLVKYEDEHMLARDLSEDDIDSKFRIRVHTAYYAINKFSQRSSGLEMLFTVAAIFCTFSFFHFILFLFYRKDLSNLFFSLFNMGMGAILLVIYYLLEKENINENQESFYVKIAVVAIAVTGLSFSGLVNNLFGKFGIRYKIIVGLSITAIVLMWIMKDLAAGIIILMAFFIFFEVIFLLIRAYLRRLPGANILALGILLDFIFTSALGALFMMYRMLILSETNSQVLRIVLLVLTGLAIFSIPMSMSIYLARNVARANALLSLQLRQIASLSKEKQDILEHQKEMLEQEVADRTAELSLQKKKSDDLLLNILPEEVAEELKENGNAVARHFNNVTVLFTDFVNFTTIAEHATPEYLVSELHTYFKAFDDIMGRHGLEKIKTIGDAYLAVSGLPVEHERHAEKAVLAAIDMLDYVKEMHRSGHPFEVRVGINSGSLVAGIVGVKKFAYDIWGDTVNTASRMESNSLPGQINISESTYQLVKDMFICTSRGKLDVKNKGAMSMYFVERPVTSLPKPDHQIF